MKVPFQYFDAGGPKDEKSDCAVCALSIATGTLYKRSHKHLENHGRISGEGTPQRITNSAYANSSLGGYKIRMVYGRGRRKKRTLEYFLRKDRLPSRCILRISGHVFPIIKGVVTSHEAVGKDSVVKTVWEVSRKSG